MICPTLAEIAGFRGGRTPWRHSTASAKDKSAHEPSCDNGFRLSPKPTRANNQEVAHPVKRAPTCRNDDFHHDNDPHHEHDFGSTVVSAQSEYSGLRFRRNSSFDADGHTIFFKIDLYEEPDVKDANGKPVVTRVLTIMLAEEY